MIVLWYSHLIVVDSRFKMGIEMDSSEKFSESNNLDLANLYYIFLFCNNEFYSVWKSMS